MLSGYHISNRCFRNVFSAFYILALFNSCSNSETQNPLQAAAQPTQTVPKAKKEFPCTQQYQTLYLPAEKVKELSELDGFAKILFVPVDGVEPLILHASASKADEEATEIDVKKNFLVTDKEEGGNPDVYERPKSDCGIALTKTMIDCLLASSTKTKTFVLSPHYIETEKNSGKYIATFRLYRDSVVEARSTGLILNPSPPALRAM